MRFGYMTMNSAAGIHPATLAQELEDRGFVDRLVFTAPTGEVFPRDATLKQLDELAPLVAAYAS
jgi:hypothetical protein